MADHAVGEQGPLFCLVCSEPDCPVSANRIERPCENKIGLLCTDHTDLGEVGSFDRRMQAARR